VVHESFLFREGRGRGVTSPENEGFKLDGTARLAMLEIDLSKGSALVFPLQRKPHGFA
jgi:hypothetical protein